MSSNYLAYQGPRYRYEGPRAVEVIEAPVITFSLGGYWGDHYRSRDFYRDRARYDRDPDWRDHRRDDRRDRRDDRWDRRDDRRDARYRDDRRYDRDGRRDRDFDAAVVMRHVNVAGRPPPSRWSRSTASIDPHTACF